MLYEKLTKYAASGIYPMHMPGHKRNPGLNLPGLPYDIDITEVHGFDNLHDPRGVLRETADLAAGLYGSDKAFLLINGSTAGILSAIGAHARHGDKILMARNCHLSAYNAVALFGLKPVYIHPGTEPATGVAKSVRPEAVAAALENQPDIKLVVVTSPTFEGVISDIASIADAAHSHNVPLLVDAAHGAHLGFSPEFGGCALKAGADIVVMSLHKTLPALTQCALLHIRGGRASSDEISRLLSVFQTTSPSYVLMASIDRCLRIIASDKDRLFGDYTRNLDRLREEVSSLQNLSLLWHGPAAPPFGFFAYDPGKLVIMTTKTTLSGTAMADIMRAEHKIELEMSCAAFAVAMTGICDTEVGFERLAAALKAIDSTAQPAAAPEPGLPAPMPTQVKTPGDALNLPGNPVAIEDAGGKMSLEYIWAYPPGIPIIAPGEVIGKSIISYIAGLIKAGVNLKSTRGLLPAVIVK